MKSQIKKKCGLRQPTMKTLIVRRHGKLFQVDKVRESRPSSSVMDLKAPLFTLDSIALGPKA